MIADLKPYREYKESGQEWLGKVPAHWDLKPGHAAFSKRKVPNIGLKEKTVLSLSYGKIKVKAIDKQHGLVPESYETYQIVNEDNIIIRGTDLQNDHTSLRIGLSRNHGIISSAYICLETRDVVLPDYGYQILNVFDLTKAIYRYGSGLRQNLDHEEIKRLPVFIPPLDEQAAIVRFLDHANRKIDHFIRTKKKLIGLLNEQKQAIIHHAVTRGLNPDVPLKSSEIPQLGDIPGHWETARLSKFFTLQRGFDITKETQRKGEIPVVSSGGISSYHDEAKAIGPGVIVGRKGTAGAVYYIETNYWPHDTTLWVNDFKSNYPKFIYYILITLDLKRFDTGSANPTLNRNIIHPERIAMPPFDEQVWIAQSIDTRLKSLANTVDHTQCEIDLIQEYRTRLTADIVTGKLDVREAAEKLPEETEDLERLDEDVRLAEDDVEDEDL